MSRHPWPASSVEGCRPTGSEFVSRVGRRHGGHRWLSGLPGRGLPRTDGCPTLPAARHSEPVGDLDVVDTRADGGDGEVFAHALLEEAVAEEDSAVLEGEAVAVVPVVKHPGQQVAQGEGRKSAGAGLDRRMGAVIQETARENSRRSGEFS